MIDNKKNRLLHKAADHVRDAALALGEFEELVGMGMDRGQAQGFRFVLENIEHWLRVR